MSLTLLGLEEQRKNAELINPMEDIRICERSCFVVIDLILEIDDRASNLGWRSFDLIDRLF